MSRIILFLNPDSLFINLLSELIECEWRKKGNERKHKMEMKGEKKKISKQKRKLTYLQRI